MGQVFYVFFKENVLPFKLWFETPVVQCMMQHMTSISLDGSTSAYSTCIHYVYKCILMYLDREQ